ncbi:helix-turn-helix domain-containing protein [Conexibacter sp. W3-3-2]|uniref:helix-turn-helix domain-containing protein n=1 Tax=Conexibacter sp. W3-3-2 TaxID=2675227 RepID=UPI0012B91D85|nr:helix-turn-helix domain-containing protein [Conexibacter sp. W3-3-2]MTD43430.1 helix-turn-helix domain-containing protein [Conexibacter sp. W3-3-2]
MSAPKLIDAATAGERLGVSARWMLEQARKGTIPHVKLGRFTRFDPVTLDAWISQQHRGPDVRSSEAA